MVYTAESLPDNLYTGLDIQPAWINDKLNTYMSKLFESMNTIKGDTGSKPQGLSLSQVTVLHSLSPLSSLERNGYQ